MTDSTDRVLASINETLDDYVTWDGRSADAMRWTASSPRVPRMRVMVQEPDPEAVLAAFRVMTGALQRQFEAVKAGVLAVGKAFKHIVNANHPQLAQLQYGDDYRRHRRKCRLCNPAGNPRPLKVNGAEYQRRTRARRRRNKR